MANLEPTVPDTITAGRIYHIGNVTQNNTAIVAKKSVGSLLTLNIEPNPKKNE